MVADEPTTPRPFERRHLVVLGAITFVAIVSRLFRLGDWSFWVDEAHTFRDVTSSWSSFWDSGVSRYPLGYVTLRGLLDLGLLRGTTEGWLRLPFAFFGILSVPTLALFGRAVVGRRAALLAALLLALSPWHIYWSQNARGYSMAVFFALLSAFAGFRAVSVGSSRLALLAVGLSVVSGLTHPSGFLLLGTLGTLVLWRVWVDGELRRAWQRPQILIPAGLLMLGVLAWLLPAVVTAATKKPGFSSLHLAQTLAWFGSPAFLVAAGAGAVAAVGLAARRVAAFLLAWVVVPFGALFTCSVVMKVSAQYGVVLLPGMCLSAGFLCVSIAEGVSFGGRAAVLLRLAAPLAICMHYVSDDFLYYFSRYGERPRWRDGAVAAQLDAGNRRILLLTTNTPSLNYYMDRGAFWRDPLPEVDVVGIADWQFRDHGGVDVWFDLVRHQAAGEEREVYVVLTEPELAESDRDRAFDRLLRRHGHQIARFPAWTGPKDMTVLVYHLPPLDAERSR